MKYKRTVLSNGLRLLTIPMPSVESATVLVMVGAGSRYETRKNSGISHFLEHMAFKGTEKRPSALAISTLIDGMGGEFNAFTSKETTGYYIKSSKEHIDTSLDVLSDMLQNSLLDQAEINKERGVILEEINLYEDTPSRKIADIYECLLYGDTPMGWDIAGDKEVIRSIKRQDFANYMKNLYGANNITVIVAGGVKDDKVTKLAHKFFGKMKRFDILKHTKVVEKQKKPGILIRYKKTEQMHIAVGVRTVPLEHPDHYPLALLAAILGGGMSSRLFCEIREKRGLAYYVRTMSEHYTDCGNLFTIAGVDPKRVGDAVSVIINEYKNAEDSLIEDELNKAKEFLKGHLVLELEDSRSVAGFYGSQELLQKEIETSNQVVEEIDKVTLRDIKRVARKYFVSNNLNLAVIGGIDIKTKEGKKSLQSFEKMLTL